MPEQLFFTIEVFLNGLMAGVLYSLVALGFVLIYKASGIFNYAQGVMALFAAMTLVGIMERQSSVCASNQCNFGYKDPPLWMACECFFCINSNNGRDVC